MPFYKSKVLFYLSVWHISLGFCYCNARKMIRQAISRVFCDNCCFDCQRIHAFQNACQTSKQISMKHSDWLLCTSAFLWKARHPPSCLVESRCSRERRRWQAVTSTHWISLLSNQMLADTRLDISVKVVPWFSFQTVSLEDLSCVVMRLFSGVRLLNVTTNPFNGAQSYWFLRN